jgi:hypothetical protein
VWHSFGVRRSWAPSHPGCAATPRPWAVVYYAFGVGYQELRSTKKCDGSETARGVFHGLCGCWSAGVPVPGVAGLAGRYNSAKGRANPAVEVSSCVKPSMSEVSSPATTPKPRRRWLQFSLRTLLVLILVCGCGLGWLARETQRVRTQREAAKAIEQLGGAVSYDPVSGFGVRRVVAWLGQLFGEDLSRDVTWVVLSGTQVSDSGLVHLQGLTQLKVLRLNDTQVSNAGLTHFQGLMQLIALSLDNTQISDAGLAHLRGLTQLHVLGLANTQVNDAGLVHLQGLTQL